MKRQDMDKSCQMGGRRAKQAPRITLRPGQDNVYNNQSRDETIPKQKDSQHQLEG